MSGKSCFFIGHRETSEEICPVLCAAVEEHIVHYGVTEFIIGRYGCFDVLAAKAAKTAKQNHPKVKLPYCYPTIRLSVPFLCQMDLTVPTILLGWKMSLVRLLLSGQIGIWSIMPISSLHMCGTLPAMRKKFYNMRKGNRLKRL